MRATFLFAMLPLMAVLPASGSIIMFNGVTVIPPPPSVATGALTNDTTMFAFSEQQNVVLPESVHMAISEPGTYVCCGSSYTPIDLPAGGVVNSYFLTADPVTAQSGEPYREFNGSITFSTGETILGIMIGFQEIGNTNAFLGAPGTTYNPANDIYAGTQNGDSITLSPNRETVTVDFFVAPNHSNAIRILTAVPEPGMFLLIGTGLLAISGLVKLKTSRRRT